MNRASIDNFLLYDDCTTVIFYIFHLFKCFEQQQTKLTLVPSLSESFCGIDFL